MTAGDVTALVAAEAAVVLAEEAALEPVEPDVVETLEEDEPVEGELDAVVAAEDAVVVEAVVEVFVDEELDVLSMVPVVVPALEAVAEADEPASSEPLAPHADKTTQQANMEAPRPRDRDIKRPTGMC